MFGIFPRQWERIIRFYQRKDVKEFRVWFVKNSKFIAFFPVLYLTLSNLYLEDKLQDTEQDNKRLSKEVILFKEQSIGVFRSFDDLPEPVWSKLKSEMAFIMLRTNEAYYTEILKKLKLSRNAYIGSQDSDIYPPHIAEKFYKEDSFVAISGSRLYTIDSFNDSLGGVKTLLVLKWRKIERKDTIVMGMAISMDTILKELRDYDRRQRIKNLKYKYYGSK